MISSPMATEQQQHRQQNVIKLEADVKFEPAEPQHHQHQLQPQQQAPVPMYSVIKENGQEYILLGDTSDGEAQPAPAKQAAADNFATGGPAAALPRHRRREGRPPPQYKEPKISDTDTDDVLSDESDSSQHEAARRPQVRYER